MGGIPLSLLYLVCSFIHTVAKHSEPVNSPDSKPHHEVINTEPSQTHGLWYAFHSRCPQTTSPYATLISRLLVDSCLTGDRIAKSMVSSHRTQDTVLRGRPWGPSGPDSCKRIGVAKRENHHSFPLKRPSLGAENGTGCDSCLEYLRRLLKAHLVPDPALALGGCFDTHHYHSVPSTPAICDIYFWTHAFPLLSFPHH